MMPKELNKQAAQLIEFLGLLDKVAESRWPYEQKRRIENLNKVVNSPLFTGKTAKRLDRIVQSGSLADSALLRSGQLKKIVSKFASSGRDALHASRGIRNDVMTRGDACPTIKQALWGKNPVVLPKKGIVERMINFPSKHPKLTMFGGGLGLGYWLANKKNTTNTYYQDEQPYGYQ